MSTAAGKLRATLGLMRKAASSQQSGVSMSRAMLGACQHRRELADGAEQTAHTTGKALFGGGLEANDRARVANTRLHRASDARSRADGVVEVAQGAVAVRMPLEE